MLAKIVSEGRDARVVSLVSFCYVYLKGRVLALSFDDGVVDVGFFTSDIFIVIVGH